MPFLALQRGLARFFANRKVRLTGSAGLLLTFVLSIAGAASATTSTYSATARSAHIYEAINDTATLSGGESPTGTITFKAYGPGDTTCSTAPVFSSTIAVSGNGSYDSGPYVTNSLGTYRWTAEYSGDAGNEARTTACNAPGQTSTASRYVTSPASSATNSTFPGTINDTTTILGGHEISGSIRFKAFGPEDLTCAKTPVYTRASRVSGPGPYESLDFTPVTPGSYRWTVEYSGDAYNEGVTSACNAADQTSTVAKATPTITTQASDSIAGGEIHDTITISGGYSPDAFITIDLYSSEDCSPFAIRAGFYVRIQGNGTFTSPSYLNAEAGRYNWTVSFPGDANNDPAVSPCNAPNETSTVSKVQPTISNSATDGKVGSPIHDEVALAGGHEATGIFYFKAYGPNDPTCSGNPAFSSLGADDLGGETFGSNPFTPTEAGTYRWVVEYLGNGNNEPATSGCNAPDAAFTVAKATPSIATQATDGVVGSAIHDSTTLADAVGAGGTITFKVYGPNDPACSGTPAFTDVQTLGGSVTARSADFFAGVVGSYRWTAEYSGDADNEGATGGCNATNETSRVVEAAPRITSEASPGSVVPGPIHSIGTLSDAQNPTGTILFTAFGPDDATCSRPPVFSSTVSAEGNGTYRSADFSPSMPGTYRWISSYSGDANNLPASSGCGEASQTVASSASPPAAPAGPATPAGPAAPLSPQASAAPAASQAGAPSPCGPVPASLRVAHRKPRKKGARPVPGVRAKIRLAKPARLTVKTALKYHRHGRRRSVKLSATSLIGHRSTMMKLALPKRLAKSLPVGRKVSLVLTIVSHPFDGPTCSAGPSRTTRRLKTKVRRLIVG